MSGYSGLSDDFYFKALIKGHSYEINSRGMTVKQPASCTRLQISNLPPLKLPASIDDFVYARIVNIEGLKRFFGTLERNRAVLNNLRNMLDDLVTANPEPLYDPAPGEVVLIRIDDRFFRGCVVRKVHFMSCLTYLIDSGITMEVALEQFYTISKEMLEIPPQAFLMLLDIDFEYSCTLKAQIYKLLGNNVVAFRLRGVSENGEAFIGTMIVRNDVGEICDVGAILQRRQAKIRVQEEDESESKEDSASIVSIDEPLSTSLEPSHSEKPASVWNFSENFIPPYTECDWNNADIAEPDCLSKDLMKTEPKEENDYVDLLCTDSEESDGLVSTRQSSFIKNDTQENKFADERQISVGKILRGVYLPVKDSSPSLFYLQFVVGSGSFEEMRTYFTQLFGKYDNVWHKLQVISDELDEGDDRNETAYARVDSTVDSYTACCYGSEPMEVACRSRFKAAFACRLACSAPKPFNDNVYSADAKTYFTTTLKNQTHCDVYIKRILRKYILDVEIFLPGGVNLFNKLCELELAQHRWTWKPPLYRMEFLNALEILQRTDDEDNVQMIFTVQMESERNNLQKLQEQLKHSNRLLRNPEITDICIVEYEGQLFRGEIVDRANKEGTFVIRYVDFGDEQEFSLNSLYAVDNRAILETPVFGIKCRLGWIRPSGSGLDMQADMWSRQALKIINSAIPLNKHFSAFIGPPEADDVHPIRVVVDINIFRNNDLATALVWDGLAVYESCNKYPIVGDFLIKKNLISKYLNMENGIIYGLPDFFESWLNNHQSFFEKLEIDTEIRDNGDLVGFVLYQNEYCRAIKLKTGMEFNKETFFLIDEGRTVNLCRENGKSSLISFCALKDPHVAFYMRACPGLALSLRLENRELSLDIEESLKNICCQKKGMSFSACISGYNRVENNGFFVDDIKFIDGTSLVHILSNSEFAEELVNMKNSNLSKE